MFIAAVYHYQREDMKYNESYPPNEQQFKEEKMKMVSKIKFYEVHLCFKREINILLEIHSDHTGSTGCNIASCFNIGYKYMHNIKLILST